jgi:hypothetical protein
MPQPIKKSELHENDILKELILQFEEASRQNAIFNKGLKESARLLKSNLNAKGVNDTESIKEANIRLKEANLLFQQKLKLEEANRKNAITEEKLKQQQIRTQEQLNRQTEREIKNQTRLESRYARVNSWLGKLRKEYRDLAIKKELGINLTTKEEFRYATLEKRITTYDNALKKVDASMGNHQRHVGNYGRAWDGLGNSVSQLAREMPAFANSVQTGFMAISNNLPMFFDEIQKIKVANKDLIAQGKPVESVFMKLGKSIFSMNTLLSVGVTLLTFFGARIIDWISSLGKETEAIDNSIDKKKELAEVSKEQSEHIGKESTKFVGLIDVLKQTNKGSQERIDLIKQINDKYGTTLKNLQDEKLFQDQLNQSVANYIEFKRVEFNLIKNEEERSSVLSRIDSAQKRVNELNTIITQTNIEKAKIDEQLKRGELDLTDREVRQKINGINSASLRINQMRQEKKSLTDEITSLEIREQELAGADLDLLRKQKSLDFGGKAGERQEATELRNLERDIHDERLKQIKDELEQKIQMLAVTSERRIEDLKKVNATEEQKAELIRLINENLFNEIVAIEEEYWAKHQEMIDKAVKEAQDSEQAQIDEAFERSNDRLEREAKETELSIELSNVKGEEKKKLEIANEIDLLEQQIELRKKFGKDTLDLEIELAKLRGEKEKEIEIKQTRDISQVIKLASDFFIEQSNRRIEALDREIKAHEKKASTLEQLAISGNINAKESLAIEQKLIVEANRKKEAERKRQERIKLAEATFTAYNKNADDPNVKNPLTKTITDITLLREFVKSLPSFDVGTEDTGSNGKGVDGKGGFFSILHPNERVLTKEQNSLIGDISNNDLAETMVKVRTGQLVSLHEGATSINQNWNITPLLGKLDQLEKAIVNKPETNIELGEITQHAMEIVKTKTKGNTIYRNKYIVK